MEEEEEEIKDTINRETADKYREMATQEQPQHPELMPQISEPLLPNNPAEIVNKENLQRRPRRNIEPLTFIISSIIIWYTEQYRS